MEKIKRFAGYVVWTVKVLFVLLGLGLAGVVVLNLLAIAVAALVFFLAVPFIFGLVMALQFLGA